MGFYRKFHGTLKANKLKDETTRKRLAQGIIHPESKRPLKHLLDHHKPFPREEAKQLAKDLHIRAKVRAWSGNELSIGDLEPSRLPRPVPAHRPRSFWYAVRSTAGMGIPVAPTRSTASSSHVTPAARSSSPLLHLRCEAHCNMFLAQAGFHLKAASTRVH